MLNELYTFAEPVQVVPFSSLKWGKFTLLHTINSLEDYSQIGFICNKDGRIFGVSTIGTTQSFFDQEFRYAKYEINR